MNSNFSNCNTSTPDDQNILCIYLNGTDHLVIIKLNRGLQGNYERVVFPKQRLLFEGRSEAWLEVYHSQGSGPILCDRIACHQLQVLEPKDCVSSPQAVYAVL